MSARARLFAAILVAVWVLIFLAGAFYQVDETEMAIVTQFGRTVGLPVTEAGLSMKIPFVQGVTRFDKRLIEWDGDENQVPTRDKQFITVDTFALWRISDPLLFFQRLHEERHAIPRLDDILDGVTRNTVARHDLVELVRGGSREALSREILAQASERVGDLGIEILDVRFKRINYIEELRQDAFARMITANKMRALEIYQETLDFLRADDIDDSLQRAQIGDLLAEIEERQRRLGR